MDDNKLRFFREILEKNHIKNGDCIEWTGKLNHDGYGYFRAFKENWMVHRVSYIVNIGLIPKGLYICHKCNNRKCFSIDHIYAGTAQQNADDRVEHLKEIYKETMEEYNTLCEKRMLKSIIDQQNAILNLSGFYTVEEYAKILNCHPNTVLNSIKTGYLEAIRLGDGKKSSYRIPKSEPYRLALINLKEIFRNSYDPDCQCSVKGGLNEQKSPEL